MALRVGWRTRLAVVASAAALGIGVLWMGNRDRRERDELLELGVSSGLDVRRPEALETVAVAGASDLALMPLVDAALRDAVGRQPLRGLSPPERRAWIEAASGLQAHLDALRDRLLMAAARRPGWAYHRLLLGQVVFVGDRRAARQVLTSEPARWIVPLRLATRAAPEDEAPLEFLAAAALETWPALTPEVRRDLLPDVGRALADTSFAARSFGAVLERLGPAESISLLPPSAAPWRAAWQALAAGGYVAELRVAYRRWEELERRERSLGLDELERTAAKGTVAELRTAWLRWLRDHPVREFDDAEGRRQAARLLEIWPGGPPGPWRTDPRGDLARYFLDGRLGVARPGALARLAGDLSNQPPAVAALMELLGGNRFAADRAERESTTFGTNEWTPFLVAWARKELSDGRPAWATDALSKVAPSARLECEVLLVRRDAARRQNALAELEHVERSLPGMLVAEIPRQAWTDRLSTSLCLDPEAYEGGELVVRLEAPSPALVSYGWDSGRLATASVPAGRSELRIGLTGLWGRRALSLVPIPKGSLSVLDARVELGPAPASRTPAS